METQSSLLNNIFSNPWESMSTQGKIQRVTTIVIASLLALSLAAFSGLGGHYGFHEVLQQGKIALITEPVALLSLWAFTMAVTNLCLKNLNKQGQIKIENQKIENSKSRLTYEKVLNGNVSEITQIDNENLKQIIKEGKQINLIPYAVVSSVSKNKSEIKQILTDDDFDRDDTTYFPRRLPDVFPENFKKGNWEIIDGQYSLLELAIRGKNLEGVQLLIANGHVPAVQEETIEYLCKDPSLENLKIINELIKANGHLFVEKQSTIFAHCFNKFIENITTEHLSSSEWKREFCTFFVISEMEANGNKVVKNGQLETKTYGSWYLESLLTDQRFNELPGGYDLAKEIASKVNIETRFVLAHLKTEDEALNLLNDRGNWVIDKDPHGLFRICQECLKKGWSKALKKVFELLTTKDRSDLLLSLNVSDINFIKKLIKAYPQTVEKQHIEKWINNDQFLKNTDFRYDILEANLGFLNENECLEILLNAKVDGRLIQLLTNSKTEHLEEKYVNKWIDDDQDFFDQFNVGDKLSTYCQYALEHQKAKALTSLVKNFKESDLPNCLDLIDYAITNEIPVEFLKILVQPFEKLKIDIRSFERGKTIVSTALKNSAGDNKYHIDVALVLLELLKKFKN